MDITEDTFPVFKANQVLTNAHLNDMFEYLDEQSRLTRANLIGIGIACGLEVVFNGTTTISLSHGCGITSEGYLILEPDDVDLVAVRPYTLPADPPYAPFFTAASPPVQYSLWELLTDQDETGAVLLTNPLVDLTQKAVVLFLELRRDESSTCGPNDCDDRGAQVTATLRRLLVDVGDLDTIVTAADPARTYLGAELTERLNLPDLRMPRFDVRNTGPVQTAQVLKAFQEVFSANGLATATAKALTALYDAFAPLVDDLFPANPFTLFLNRFGFLDSGPVTPGQVRFLQYYWDLFDDLLAAYDELRWKGVDLLCACCPPAGLFPRHLMAGVVDPTTHDPADYRQAFVRSPAVGDCPERSREVRQLFRRLVAMTGAFQEEAADQGIRATPSRWGDAPVSVKAIPFYYDQQGNPPLYQLWDPVRTARHRANQNLSYRATEYVPVPPTFVIDPLRYDLEPNGFLRIEGHLGLNVRSALETLLTLRDTYRLPIEVVALRTGAFDESMPVDLGAEECRFQDLETLYDSLRAELLCFLVKQVTFLYDLPDPLPGPVVGQPGTPVLPILKALAPDFRVEPGTLGYRIESTLSWTPGRPLPWIVVLGQIPDAYVQLNALVGAMSSLAFLFPDDLQQLDLAKATPVYDDMVARARLLETIRRTGAYDPPGFADRLDDIVFGCRLDPFESLVEEWKRRVRDAQQAQFLGHFLAANPGIQHKAGVPLGGTFILVYHEPPGRSVPTPGPVFQLAGPALPPGRFPPIPDVYAQTVAALPSGTVVADFFLPYIGGAGCGGVQYQLPPSRLRVSAAAACTEDDGIAQVTVTVEGTSGPLSVKVDQGPFGELAGPVPLPVGDHTLVVRDSTGVESLPVPVTIPPPLRITDSHVEVNPAGDAWQVIFTISGGVGPFAADQGAVADRTYTGPPLALADVLTVQIKDAAGCTVAGQFVSGVEPCALPWEGEAVRTGYRFWLPEPPKGSPINNFTAAVKSFVVTDDLGAQHDLAVDVDKIFPKPPPPGQPLPSIPSTDFLKRVQTWLKAVNGLVAAEFNSPEWLILEYEPATGQGTTGSLFIDRLLHLDFLFQITVDFEQNGRRYLFEITYTPSGTSIAIPQVDNPAWVSAFDPSVSKKCPPTEPPTPLCTDIDLQVKITRSGKTPSVVLTAASTGGVPATDQYFWQIQDGIPSLATGPSVTAAFQPTEPADKLIRVTAFSKAGCSRTFEQVINIFNP